MAKNRHGRLLRGAAVADAFQPEKRKDTDTR